MALGLNRPATAQDAYRVITDPRGDFRIRKTDMSEAGWVDPTRHRVIDLLSIAIGNWSSPAPERNVFEGRYERGGEFLRMELRIDGLVNPPGDTDPRAYQPFRFGPHPVYGFIEIDVDQNVETGGELERPDVRYLGNVARFGGKPAAPRFINRVATRAADYHLPFDRPPLVKRHGEEFHLALTGSDYGDGRFIEIAGNGNEVFEASEIWRIRAPLFHRAHGFEPFCFEQGCRMDGGYWPDVDLEFRHAARDDVTIVTLVFPLTQQAAARLRGELPQPPDASDCNHTSIFEALALLVENAQFWMRHPGPPMEKHIIIGWAHRRPLEHLQPAAWDLTALLGTTYAQRQRTAQYVWTDVWPSVVPGDVNGDGERNLTDQRIIMEYTGGRPLAIEAFAQDFSLYDVNYSGEIDALDWEFRPRIFDGDGDDDVDVGDFRLFHTCFSGSNAQYPFDRCKLMDIDRDGDVDLTDLSAFGPWFRGPGVR